MFFSTGAPTGDRDIVFATVGEHALRLELHLPVLPAAPIPLVIWIHGGGWRKGTRAVYPPALRLLDFGFAVASIDYRLSSEALFPAQIGDCRAAVRFLRANARIYGIDPARIGAWGSSAGGHLSALLGTSAHRTDWDSVGDHREVSAAVQAVCDWYGPTDILRMNDRPGHIDHNRPDSPEGLLIGFPAQQDPVRASEPNPIRYITDATPPFLIMHGSEDLTVIPEQSRLLHEALSAADRPSELVMVPDSRHGFDVVNKPWILEKAVGFFGLSLGADQS